MSNKLVQFVNCTVLRDHELVKEDFWVRGGKIVNPEKVFYIEKRKADTVVDCKGAVIAPGFIELQINGAFGVDFSKIENIEDGINRVAKGLLSHGVTSFCPTVVTSPLEIYHTVLRRIKKRPGNKNGATILGIHVEGPFINVEKKGAHPPECIKRLENGMETLREVYGCLDNIVIVTLAPELENSDSVIRQLTSMGIVVSLGHSMGNLKDGERAVRNGATLITHLFNAMLPFHHRDPGLVGLLTSEKLPRDKTVYFGIISDGTHTHPAALRIAHRVHPDGLIVVTDAISALGLEEGKHKIGQLQIEIRGGKAYIAGTNTLCGSIDNMAECVKVFWKSTRCSLAHALDVATFHPANVLGITKSKGTLDFDADADFIMIDNDLNILSTWIAGECVYEKH